jgi:30S ribosome assembly GTPase
MTILPNKQISSFSMNVKQAYTVWLGALARLDFLSGDDKFFTFFVAPHVTIHRTPIHKAQTVYEANAGTLLRPAYNQAPLSMEFVQHQLALTCDKYKLANFEIAIEGLGWFSIQGKGFITMMLHLPKDVKYHIRSEPMFPFEVIDKGLKRFTGNTVNAHTKRNK